MNEEFIKQFRKSLETQFVEKIHARLERRERVHRYKNYLTRSALALLLMFGLLMTFSSTARVVFAQSIEQSIFAEFLTCYTGYKPVDDIETTPDIIYFKCQGFQVATINPSQYLTLEDAQARFPSPIVLPSYVPHGFERRADLEFFDLTDQPTLVITWDLKDNYKRIKLLASHNSMELENYSQSLGDWAMEKTTLNGEPAIIVRGTWNMNAQESGFMMNGIMWRYDENTVYALMSLEQAVPLDELIKIAESIP